jgi:flagellin-like protein
MFKKISKNDEGVSAVIGVILMVAITVILAAVIAAFVFGMVGNVNQKHTPSFTVTRIDASNVQVTLQSMGGATNVTNFQTTQPATAGDIAWNRDGVLSTTPLEVGDVGTIANVPSTSTLVCSADVDGTPTVILDTQI